MKRMAEKIFVLGIDGMDPKLTRKFIKQGKMPNTQKFLARGAARADLAMLGAHPCVTPPMWTTMATGAYPITHGMAPGFNRLVPGKPELSAYNFNSLDCRAEPLWNVFAENGLKTLVFHWPGSSWPPTSDSPDLHVVDGTQPAAVNMGVAQIESEFIFVASDRTEAVHFREKAASDSNVPCVITDLEVTKDVFNLADVVTGNEFFLMVMKEEDGSDSLTDTPFDVELSPIKPAEGWVNAPAHAKEFTMLFSKGLIHRVGLILPNAEGIYDRVALYKSKKSAEPFAVLEKNVFQGGVIDEGIKNDVHYPVNRNMRVLELSDDGNYLKIWVSAAMILNNDDVWHPKRLYQEVVEHVGYPSPESMLGAADPVLIVDCMLANWEYMAEWEAGAILHLMAAENYDMVFSHFHNIDGMGHMIMKFLKDRGKNKLSEEQYAQFLELVYEQTDRYIGQFLELLDEGWTVLIVSDHGQVTPEHDTDVFRLCSAGINASEMRKLGYTVLKKDADGNDLPEVDWSKTTAVCSVYCHIFLNIKGREPHGIVDPADQFELEEKIMTDLYSLRDEKTGHRIVALALRNRDAALLGEGGPESGDIIYYIAEGYNGDHSDSFSTINGACGTSVRSVFMAAGPGIKANCLTDRIIKHVDVTPTAATLLGVRMPRDCEGAPIYQILE